MDSPDMSAACGVVTAPLVKNNATKATTTAERNPSDQRQIAWKEFKQQHCNSNKNNTDEKSSRPVWIAIHGRVYDVTQFKDIHPGGSQILEEYSGRDATDEFDAFHMPRVRRSRLPAYCIGTLGMEKNSRVMEEIHKESGNMTSSIVPKELASTRDYRALKTKLWKEGWFEADLDYYIQRDMIALGLLLTGLSCMIFGTRYITRTIVGGILVGLAIQQVAFVAHDSAHHGVYHPKRNGGINWMAWFHGSLCFGISMEMWNDEHTAHHAMTMRPRKDPQFNYLPIFLISKKELNHLDELLKIERYIARRLVPFQHLILIPLCLLIGRFNLHIISMVYAVKQKKVHDLFGILMYLSWFVSIVTILPKEEQIFFVLISYMVAGILHIQLVISHLATDAFTADEQELMQFFAHQCKTTRNIDSQSWLADWFHGGLQYQIEHHLFPQMPRHNLEKIQPLVLELCNKHNIPYTSMSFTSAVGECLMDFHRMRHFMEDLYYPQG